MKRLATICLALSQLVVPCLAAGSEILRLDGCGKPGPPEPPSSAEVDGRTRDFIAVIPEPYNAEVAHRLIFAFHGRTTANSRARSYFRIEQSSTSPTIFVYPAGLLGEDGKYSWYERGQSGDNLRDYLLFDTLLESLSATYCIDLDRVFVVGHSLGGSFANSLGCARGAAIRGVGTVAGRVWDTDCSGAAATMILHNPRDYLVPVARGEYARDRALLQNSLGPPAEPCEPRTLNCECYGPAGAENPVVWCPHNENKIRSGEDYPHLWPHEAGEAIMSFFDSLDSAVDGSAGAVGSEDR